MSDKELSGIDAIQFVGTALFLSPIIVGAVVIILEMIFPGHPISDTLYLLGSIMMAGLICLIRASITRYSEGKESVRKS